jgi:hypothetical protein
MKINILNLIVIVSILFLFNSCSSNNENWIRLFDGKTIEGWKATKDTNTNWYVEDSALVGVVTTTMYHIHSLERYRNFILELEFKLDSGVNSGVQFRSDYLKNDKKCNYVRGTDLKSVEKTFKAGEFAGYQVEIETTSRAWCGGLYEECGRGWMQPLNHDEPARNALKAGDWNHLRIRADGDHIQSWLNGAKATDFYDKQSAEGLIGFQVHDSNVKEIVGKKVRFKNIQLMKL